jgi:hypothetical protein
MGGCTYWIECVPTVARDLIETNDVFATSKHCGKVRVVLAEVPAGRGRLREVPLLRRSTSREMQTRLGSHSLVRQDPRQLRKYSYRLLSVSVAGLI